MAWLFNFASLCFLCYCPAAKESSLEVTKFGPLVYFYESKRVLSTLLLQLPLIASKKKTFKMLYLEDYLESKWSFVMDLVPLVMPEFLLSDLAESVSTVG